MPASRNATRLVRLHDWGANQSANHSLQSGFAMQSGFAVCGIWANPLISLKYFRLCRKSLDQLPSEGITTNVDSNGSQLAYLGVDHQPMYDGAHATAIAVRKSLRVTNPISG